MKRSKEPIPNFHLPETARSGILINSSGEINKAGHDIHLPHRDEHYLLIMMFDGCFKALVDFKQFEVAGSAVALILPGQVHQVLEINKGKTVTISFDPLLVASELIPVLQSYFYKQTVLPEDDILFRELSALLQILIAKKDHHTKPIHAFVMHVTLQNMLALIACKIQSVNNAGTIEKRPALIVQQFKTLLQQSFRQLKKPSDYAKALHISVKHLNDTVKASTGFSVSFHIQQEIMLEARRLLYHSPLSVKETAYTLGYEDVVYFTRLFKKTTGLTPLSFRRQFSH
ncbi:helix-turn-helix domain-containing protein [Parafilimonas sp.]|uniref:AraC family transcriptional regulator n=1 Tax=Parafilimonas sp. TaxID=1969739 RepID=UPI0039E5A455